MNIKQSYMFKRYPLQEMESDKRTHMERIENNSYAFGEIRMIGGAVGIKRSLYPTFWTKVWHFSSFVRSFNYKSKTPKSSFVHNSYYFRYFLEIVIVHGH